MEIDTEFIIRLNKQEMDFLVNWLDDSCSHQVQTGDWDDGEELAFAEIHNKLISARQGED